MLILTLARNLALSLALFLAAVPVDAIFIDALVIEETPHSDPAMNAAATAFAGGDLERARKLVDDVLAREPDNVAALLLMADLAWTEQDPDTTRIHLNRAVAVGADNAAVQTAMGRFLYLQKEFAGAVEYFERAVELDPELIDPLIELGSLYAGAQGQMAKADTYYARAIDLAPTRMELRYARAVVLASMDKLGAAMEELEFAGDYLESDPYPFQLMGTIYADEGDSARALEAFDRALKRSPDLPAAVWARSELLLDSRRLVEAQAGYEHMVRLQPEYAPARTRLGLVLQLQGDFSAAESSYLAAVRLNPQDALAYNNLAYGASLQAGRGAQALEWAERAVELQPANPEFRETLAMVHQRNGRLDKAEKILNAIVSEYPEFTPAVKRLAEVRAARAES